VTRIRMVDQGFSLPSPQHRRRACAPGGVRVRVRVRVAVAVAVAAALALAAVAGPAAATLYKWVDANGRVVYSDQPPPANLKSEIVTPPPPPANPNAAKELQDQDLAIKQREKKRADEAKAADKAQQASQVRRENCVNALGKMKALQQADDSVFRFNEKGEKIFFDDETRREEFERQQQIARENCPG
jgi:hypothetical protein